MHHSSRYERFQIERTTINNRQRTKSESLFSFLDVLVVRVFRLSNCFPLLVVCRFVCCLVRFRFVDLSKSVRWTRRAPFFVSFPRRLVWICSRLDLCVCVWPGRQQGRTASVMSTCMRVPSFGFLFPRTVDGNGRIHGRFAFSCPVSSRRRGETTHKYSRRHPAWMPANRKAMPDCRSIFIDQ